jgi:hypothetical protein
MPRNYRNEYDAYQGSETQKKNRAKRNAARRKLEDEGRVHKGDGKDVIHRNGNPKDNKDSNLGVQDKSKNRSYPRNRNGGKKNPSD